MSAAPTDTHLTPLDWLAAIVCPPLGTIVGLFYLVKGSRKAGDMLLASILASVVFGAFVISLSVGLLEPRPDPQQQLAALLQIYFFSPVGIVYWIINLVCFVCYLIVVVKMFQHNEAALGILALIGFFVFGLGYLFALIFGWSKSSDWNIRPVMLVWTLAYFITVGLVVYMNVALQAALR
jgi:drug/metabolite transporter (DMT)-like permease